MSRLISISRTILMAIALFGAASIQSSITYAQDTIDAEERARVETIVRDYLLKNPEVILEAIRALEQREKASANQQRDAYIANLVPALSSNPLTPSYGPADSDVVVVEFFDYQCGYCKRMFPAVQNVMTNDDRLKVIFVEFPILGPASLIASKAALAAREQGKYLEYHVAMMTFQGRLTEEVIFQKAADIGLDIDKLKQDMEAPKIAAYLQMTRDLAENLNIRGTPAMVIGDQFIGGFVPDAQFLDTIAKARG